jgi:hypothetical protein
MWGCVVCAVWGQVSDEEERKKERHCFEKKYTPTFQASFWLQADALPHPNTGKMAKREALITPIEDWDTALADERLLGK